MGGTDFDDVSRLDGVRDSSEWAGNCGADDVEYDGDISARQVRTQFRRRFAHDDRSEKAGVRRHVPLCSRSEIQQSAGGGNAVEGVRSSSRETDRYGKSELQCIARRTRVSDERGYDI